MGFIVFQNLFLKTACTVDLGYSEDFCFHSNKTVKRKIEVIQLTYTQNYQILHTNQIIIFISNRWKAKRLSLLCRLGVTL